MRNKQRQLLMELRSVLIAKKATLPYCIYTDETIEDLLDAQPKTIAELAKIKGFPEKGKRFGEAVVAIFRDTDKIDSFDLEEGKNSDVSVGTHLKRLSAF